MTEDERKVKVEVKVKRIHHKEHEEREGRGGRLRLRLRSREFTTKSTKNTKEPVFLALIRGRIVDTALQLGYSRY